jgi:hypothetical protein
MRGFDIMGLFDVAIEGAESGLLDLLIIEPIDKFLDIVDSIAFLEVEPIEFLAMEFLAIEFFAIVGAISSCSISSSKGCVVVMPTILFKKSILYYHSIFKPGTSY